MSIISKFTGIFRKKDEQDVSDSEETPGRKNINIREYINKFVKQNQTDIGETVTVHDGKLIVKNRDGFMAVPFDAVKDNSENIIVGDFDREKALMLGKEWFERKDTLKFDENGMMIKQE